MDDQQDFSNNRSAGAEAPVFRFKEIVGDAFSCFGNNFVLVLLLVLSVTLPMALIQVFVVNRSFSMSGINDLLAAAGQSTASEEEVASLLSSAGSKLLLYLGISTLISSVSLICESGMIILVGRHNGIIGSENGGKMTFGMLFESALRSFPKLWLTMLFVHFSVFCGLMLCFIPGILVFYIFQFSQYSVELTRLWGRKATFVSSLATRKFPRVAVICAVSSFALSHVLIPFSVSGLVSLVSLSGAGAVPLGIAEVLLTCVEQLMRLFEAAVFATVFARMLPVIDPVIDASGVRGSGGGK